MFQILAEFLNAVVAKCSNYYEKLNVFFVFLIENISVTEGYQVGTIRLSVIPQYLIARPFGYFHLIEAVSQIVIYSVKHVVFILLEPVPEDVINQFERLVVIT